jgi:hypothetical protein
MSFLFNNMHTGVVSLTTTLNKKEAKKPTIFSPQPSYWIRPKAAAAAAAAARREKKKQIGGGG